MSSSSSQLSSAYRLCERIAKKNHPYLYLVARYFEDREKYKAFCATYASMRIIDDQIDSIPWRGKLSPAKKLSYRKNIGEWLEQIEACRNGYSSHEPIFVALQDTFQKLPIPLFPWRTLAKAMQADVGKDSFETLEEFIRYAEGAAVAPATVFMFLLTAQKDGANYGWEFSEKEIYTFARELALFCYLTHIIRDVSSDLQLGKSGLLYIPVRDLVRHNLNKQVLIEFKKEKKVNSKFQRLAARYVKLARAYEVRGRRLLKGLNRQISEDSRFILNLLLEFYAATLKKIEKANYNVFSGKEKLTKAEEVALIRRIARQMGFKLKYV